jgi:hypothetical protein
MPQRPTINPFNLTTLGLDLNSCLVAGCDWRLVMSHLSDDKDGTGANKDKFWIWMRMWMTEQRLKGYLYRTLRSIC